LTKCYGNNTFEYAFKLCCKQLVTLQRECNEKNIALKIPKCFQLPDHDSIFQVESADNIKVEYTNVTSGESHEDNNAQWRSFKGYWLYDINVDEDEECNVLCFDSICLPVKPNCLKNYKGINFLLNEICPFVNVDCMPTLACAYDASATNQYSFQVVDAPEGADFTWASTNVSAQFEDTNDLEDNDDAGETTNPTYLPPIEVAEGDVITVTVSVDGSNDLVLRKTLSLVA
jgi:hypothetical protein